MKSFYYFFPQSPSLRKAADNWRSNAPENLERIYLFGADELKRAGVDVTCNCEEAAASFVNALICWLGRQFYSLFFPALNGRWREVARYLDEARRHDVVYAFTDSIGVPLLTLKYLGLFAPKVVYVSIGLPERISKLKKSRRWVLKPLFDQASAVIAYGYGEKRFIEKLFASFKIPVKVEFISFGVDSSAWAPCAQDIEIKYDAVCIGADYLRDVDLFFALAKKYPSLNFAWVATKWVFNQYSHRIPVNVKTMTDIPLSDVRRIIREARFIALPVKNNSYSGATITLLTSMAMGKAIVVSQTPAIKDGYHLHDGVNCMLATPGDELEFIAKATVLLDNASVRNKLGEAALKTAEERHGWYQFALRHMEVVK